MRRKLPGDAPPSAAGAAGAGHAPSASAPSEADLAQLSAAIAADEDLGPFVRRAFACGRPEPLLASLRAAARNREAEIEELCRAHFHDFIRAVDDLRTLLADADALKGSLSASHSQLLSSAAPLLASLESFLVARSLAGNLSSALASSAAGRLDRTSQGGAVRPDLAGGAAGVASVQARQEEPNKQKT